MKSNDLINFIKSRRSIRKFKDWTIENSKIEAILETAVQAPSSKNIQNWNFVILKHSRLVITDLILKKQIEVNEPGSVIESCKIIKEAPVLILVFNTSPYIRGEKNLEKDSGLYSRIKWSVEIQSISAAIQNILLASKALGLGSLWIADVLFAKKEIENFLEIKSDLVAAISVGYADEYKKIPKRDLKIIINEK